MLDHVASVLNPMIAATPAQTQDGWPWAGSVMATNVVEVEIDRDVYRRHKAAIDKALRANVDRGELELKTDRPFRQVTVNKYVGERVYGAEVPVVSGR